MSKLLKGKSLTLTFGPGQAKNYPSHGVHYKVGEEVPEEHWHYAEKAGEGRYLEEKEVPKPKPKKVSKKKKEPVKKAEEEPAKEE
jgi:hypothetical protein|tara:strand:+ start:2669 stop:2923 length:255 start_codon:yes stop_codon:yes gene_type:complete